ncbi:hypothetical protein HOLleu_10798 [Holothuria leucospilota]|uniref:Uncharacterized protein n=1 Tax=Holothuria leucospilota TaxID=206669 RepID=A0A9Q1HF44_HOLLE|nr:hypothetical protein HOLleu_10798 [Holothuria leucospilota]
MAQWPFQYFNMLYLVFLLLNFVECCLAQFAFDEDFFAKLSVGIFACFVIGFTFSVILGFLWQFSRLIGSKQPTSESDDKAKVTPSTSRVIHTDGQMVNVVSLNDLDASDVSHASLSHRNALSPLGGRFYPTRDNDIRESLYADIDLTKKKSRPVPFVAERYPVVDYN